MVSLPVMLVV